MASRGPNDGHVRPDLGDVLMVIPRSSDELSLAKGDRVELIERDDEFGDGWFLGRHLVNSNTGLFPEVYTRPAPKNIPTSSFAPSKPLAPLHEVTQEPKLIGGPGAASSLDSVPKTSQPPTISQPNDAPVTLPLNSVKSESPLASSLAGKGSPLVGLGHLNSASQDNHVLNETLNVIDEHITDLRSPSSNGALRNAATDSGSEYSSNHLDHRASYIHGEETDEEEEGLHSRAEVESWSPDAVAEYLFTSGVEKHHCEVFRDQEISGEVLLGMDQSSLFIKAFDLGSVGRRLKTWHKIKTLQDEVNNQGFETRRTTQTYGSESGENGGRRRSRTNTLTNRPTSIQTRRLSLSQTPKASPTSLTGPISPKNLQDGANHIKRPSAASVRELHHSRRHSSTDYRGAPMAGTTPIPKITNTGTFPPTDATHKKQPSFDRNWTLGSAYTSTSPRPLSSTGLQDMLSPPDGEHQDSAVDLDRGYFSGTEIDGRRRNVLRKRDSGAHSRKSSYTEEQRVRSATTISRHSRFGSMSSVNEGGVSPAAQKYYGIPSGPHRRTASTTTTESIRNMPAASNGPSPTVTKLDTSVANARSPASSTPAPKHQGFNSDWLASVVNKPLSMAGSGMRAISDNLSIDRSKVVTPPVDSPKKDSVDSPARTGSTTPSGGPSFDLESPDMAKSPSTTTTQSKNSRKKGKKETSAYTQGLLKISPQEGMKGADYSGWMRKKSSNLMTTWKPRLFVLKGRRLAYYYSEDDDQEKGLIDISFHRVLPADNEKLTGLHATISHAVGGQTMPANPDDGVLDKGDDSVFIFKLVPPRAGLSRAVNFTKPTVHYFAVPNLKQGRLWMAALMKATIDRDDTKPITTTYQQKTISLAKAKQMRHRPPALMNLEEAAEDEPQDEGRKDSNGLGISFDEADSGVSGVDKLATQKIESAKLNVDLVEKDNGVPPQSA
ncbi:Fc.00g102060.m01.CDS01 [Cosmosporella sp. VM-42]